MNILFAKLSFPVLFTGLLFLISGCSEEGGDSPDNFPKSNHITVDDPQILAYVEDELDSNSKVMFDRQNDVVYHKEQGYALTMDVITPRQDANGAAVLMVMSGGWCSSHDAPLPHDLDKLPETYMAQAREL